MTRREEMSKEELIRKEVTRLKRVFRDLDKNKMTTVMALIENAAFMTISLRELNDLINTNGYTTEYQNGENQWGTKQSENVKTHIAMTRNLATIIKQLSDLVPPERQKMSRLQALRQS